MKRYNIIFSTFHTLYRLITTSSNAKNFLTGVCRIYKNIFKAEKVVILSRDGDAHGFMKLRLEDNRQTFKKGGISILSAREKEILHHGIEILTNGRMVYPFIFENTLGAVYVKRKTEYGPFNEIEKKWFLSLSEQVSVGLKMFALHNEQNKMMISYVKSLTKLLNQYVPTSHIHTSCLTKLIKELTKHLKLSEAQSKCLEYAALLHDAGKIQLPSKILRKQKKLTDEEFKIVMKHPRVGVELIKDLDILKPVVPIILHHHERFDGKGYPSKLKGSQIPLGARVLSVIDSFDAMFFGRPYRKGKSFKEIEKELTKQSGKQFDPKVIDTFIKIIRGKVIRKYLLAAKNKQSCKFHSKNPIKP